MTRAGCLGRMPVCVGGRGVRVGSFAQGVAVTSEWSKRGVKASGQSERAGRACGQIRTQALVALASHTIRAKVSSVTRSVDSGGASLTRGDDALPRPAPAAHHLDSETSLTWS